MDIKKYESLLGVWIWNTSFILLCILSLFIIIILFHYLPGNFFTTKAPHFVGLYFLNVCFRRVTSRVEFDSKYCYISVSPFLRLKYEIRQMTFIGLKKLCLIQFNEAFYKIPIFMVVLNYESMNCLIKYVNSREDIKKKII